MPQVEPGGDLGQTAWSIGAGIGGTIVASKVCVAIGVSRPEGLDELKGAVLAAREMAGWAEKAGFEPHLVVDVDEAGEPQDVTTDTLRAAFANALPVNDFVEHLIIFFAGHGLSRNFNDQQWLLSKWRQFDEQSVKLSAFARMLQRYQPKRVTIIADACRNLPGPQDDTNEGVAVLPRPIDEPQPFREDRFQATEFGAAAYMLPADPPVCLFSNVMIAALGGALDEARETRPDGVYVTSDSLYAAVSKAMEAQCVLWNVPQKASLTPGFLRDANIYAKLPLDFEAPPLARPVPRIDDTFDSDSDHASDVDEADDASDVDDGPALGDGEGAAGGGGRESRGVRRSATRVPAGSEHRPSRGRTSVSRTPTRGALRGASNWVLSTVFNAPAKPPVDFAAEHRPEISRGRAGVVINGASVSKTPSVSRKHTGLLQPSKDAPSTWLLVRQPRAMGIGSLAAELPGGNWVGAALYPQRIAAISVRDAASVSLIYRHPDRKGEYAHSTAETASETLINRMLAGELDRSDMIKAATEARGLKHADPSLGSMAAYLYDAIGDRDSIRRMAWFYVDSGQPIPFDIALLADVRGERRECRLIVDIPDVPKRKSFTEDIESRNEALFRATPAVTGARVAGGFPWMRQGWGILETAALPMEPALLDLAGGCVNAPFTTLTPDAGKALAGLISSGKV